MLLGVGASTKATYVDDIFSTFLYKGNNGNTLNINNGIDLTGEGGMTWIKCRDTGSTNHSIYDTVRGASELLWTNSNAAQMDQTACGSNKALYQFNNNGFTLGGNCNGTENWDQKAFSSWSFRKTKGFFTIATWTGNSSYDQTISHDLGCEPGCIMYKSVSASGSWYVYHRGATKDKFLSLNSNGAAVSFSDTLTVTSTQFVAPGELGANTNGETYVAYLWGGGESDAATARSVEFDGSGDALTTSTSSDYTFGTGDFTVEHWINTGSTAGATSVIDARTNYTNNWTTYLNTDFTYNFYAVGGNRIVSTPLAQGTWNHVALCRSSGTTTLYLNGISQGTYSDSNNYTNTTLKLGLNFASGHAFIGKISNFRVVKGTAVYTSSFRPPTEPLTNITNTKLLCCNNSSVTGTTTGTVTSSGDPTASSDSPFDDPAGFAFGENEDQNVIKCGSYVGNGSATGPEINLGWEPQWILFKSEEEEDWKLVDSMRGIAKGNQDAALHPHENSSEFTDANYLDLTSTGFKITTNSATFNSDGKVITYTAIRRPDGYVGKPPELGTGVFAMDTGNSSSTIPTFDSGFPVDFAFERTYASTQSWYTGARLISGKYLTLNGTGAEGNASDHTFDSNTGWQKSGYNTTHQSWMWKRHAGFDVVTYTGNKIAGLQIPHSLNAVPEMMWVKNRGAAENWAVYHKGLNGGTNPEQYFINLNEDDAEYGSHNNMWNSTAPTSTHFTLGSWDEMNANNGNHIAFLFASVNGISKVGYYAGTTSNLTITTGFQPRFVIIKNITTADSWYVLDTTRGWGSGNDEYLQLNSNAAQVAHDFGAPTSTGFTLGYNNGAYNNNGDNFIYYAHA